MRLNTIIGYRLGKSSSIDQEQIGRERLYSLLNWLLDNPRKVIIGVNICILSFLFKDTPIVVLSTPWDSPLVANQLFNLLIQSTVITLFATFVLRYISKTHIPLIGDLDFIDGQLLKKDLAFLSSKLHQYPRKNLHWESCIGSIERMSRKWESDMSQMEFAVLLSEKLSNLRDGHSGINWSEQDIYAYIAQQALFPYTLIQQADKYFISENSDDQFAGKQVKKINGYPVEQLLKVMSSFSRGDTIIDKQKQALQDFSCLLYVLYGMSDDFAIRFVDEEQIVIQGKPLPSQTKAAKEDCVITLTGSDQMNVLFRQFSLSALQTFSAALSKEDAEELDTILLDLTECTGGDLQIVCDCIQVIAPSSIQYYFALQQETQQECFEASERSQIESLPCLPCELLLKIGPNTFSAGVIFAHLFQQNQLGKIYGSSTGGSPSCTGNPIAFDLPYSRLRIHLASTQITAYRSDGLPLQAHQSVHPDVFISA